MYLLKIDGFNVLIDAGLNFKHWKKKFLSGLEEFNLTIKDIDYCIVTHDHIDHIGLLKTLKRKNPDMQILMHKITHDLIKWGTDVKNNEEVEMVATELAERMIKFGISKEKGDRIVQFFSNWHKLIQYRKPDRILNDNDEILFDSNKLKVIWTPGHAVGHICIFDTGNKYLFSGDHILSRITPHIGNFVVNPDIDEKHNFDNILKHYLESLDRIDNLHPKIIFPGHQEVIYEPSVRINEIKLHHVNRLREMMKVIKNRPLTPMRISKLHFGRGLDELNSMLALSEVLGHLIYLENLDKVRRVEKNNKILFVS